MAQRTPQVSELLEKALGLSTRERGLLIDRLIESLDNEAAEKGIEAAWDEEIKRRVDDIRSGRVRAIPRNFVGFYFYFNIGAQVGSELGVRVSFFCAKMCNFEQSLPFRERIIGLLQRG